MGHLTILPPTPILPARLREYGCNIFRLYVKSMCSAGCQGRRGVAVATTALHRRRRRSLRRHSWVPSRRLSSGPVGFLRGRANFFAIVSPWPDYFTISFAAGYLAVRLRLLSNFARVWQVFIYSCSKGGSNLSRLDFSLAGFIPEEQRMVLMRNYLGHFAENLLSVTTDESINSKGCVILIGYSGILIARDLLVSLGPE